MAGRAPVRARQFLGSLLPAQRFRPSSVAGTLPAPLPDTYRLLGGLVARPLHLTLHALEERSSTTLVPDFRCVTGWRVADVRWWGVRLSTLLDGPVRRSERGRRPLRGGVPGDELTTGAFMILSV